jgi:hypothetical protein
MYAYLHILLPWDILGLFLLFALDKKSCLYFRPSTTYYGDLPLPTVGKNILETMVNNLNLTLQVANHALKDKISKSGAKFLFFFTNW